MRIHGYLDDRYTPPATSIYARIEAKGISGTPSLAFLIDTGASVTTILDSDLVKLGLDWNGLAKAPRPLGGIGGTVETRLIENSRLFFKTGSGEVVAERPTVTTQRKIYVRSSVEECPLYRNHANMRNPSGEFWDR